MSRSNASSIQAQVASWDDITLKRQQQLLDEEYAALTRELAVKKLQIQSDFTMIKHSIKVYD